MKAKNTIIERHGEDFYKTIGARGGALPPAQGGFRKRCRTVSRRKMARRPQCVICGYDRNSAKPKSDQ